jgi:hypothetical protein
MMGSGDMDPNYGLTEEELARLLQAVFNAYLRFEDSENQDDLDALHDLMMDLRSAYGQPENGEVYLKLWRAPVEGEKK